MLLELVFSQPARQHPIRWLSEAGDASFEAPVAAPTAAQFVNVPVDETALHAAVDAGLAAIDVPVIYEHVQATPLSTWTVNHNLGRSPGSVRVLSAGGVELFCDVIETSPNQLTVSFVVAQTGRVLVF